MHRVHYLIVWCFLTTALANLSLNDSGAIWQYTTSSLADTSSSECKSAYAQEIACPRHLVRLTGNPLPRNRPTVEELSAICTSKCKNSVEDYISNVEQQCKLPGDAAEETTDSQSGQFIEDYVWIAGNMLEYTWTQVCAKDRYGTTLESALDRAFLLTVTCCSNGGYCYLTKGYPNITNPDPAVDCMDLCTLQYYKNRHDYGPASTLYFARSELLEQTRQVLDSWHDEYLRMTECPGWRYETQENSQAAISSAVTAFPSTTTAADLGMATIVLSSIVGGAGSTAKPTSTPPASPNGASNRVFNSGRWLSLLVFWWIEKMNT